MSKAASTPGAATKDTTTQIPDASDSESDDDWLPGPGCIHDHPFAVVDPFPFLKLAADERRVVLSFLLGARSYPLGGRAPGAPERVRFSAVEALRTLTFHARSIKAVCRDVAADVRVLEGAPRQAHRSVATPLAWLKGLWDAEIIPGMEYTASSYVLEGCRERAAVARRGNLALAMYQQLGQHCRPRIISIKTPGHWRKRRTDAVKHFFEYQGSPLGEREHKQLSWAHTRTSTSGEMHAPVDATLLKSLCATAFNSFLEGLRSAVLSGTMWTLHVEGVQVLYRGGFVDDDDEEWADGEWLRGDDDDFDALDAGLAAFFGADAMRRPPWVQAWCNAYGRPPVTRIRDIADMVGRRPYSFNLTDRSAKAPAAVINVSFPDDIQAVEQPNTHNPTGPPAFMQLGPEIKAHCRAGSHSWRDVAFKIRTGNFWDPGVPKGSYYTHQGVVERGMGEDPPLGPDRASLFVPIVEGVFDAMCTCRIVGLN